MDGEETASSFDHTSVVLTGPNEFPMSRARLSSSLKQYWLAALNYSAPLASAEKTNRAGRGEQRSL